jgi:hypothetical protein
VNKAIDFVIKTGLKIAGPIIRGVAGISSKVKAKVAAGKAWVKGTVEAGKAWAKDKVEAGKAWVKGKLAGSEKGAKATGTAAKEAEKGAPPRPTVNVPFDMAGHGHTLTFQPTPGGVEVKMASEVLMPLTKQFRTASASIEYAKRYIASIKDPGIKKKFEEEFGQKLIDFQAPSVEAFKKAYEATFPPGKAPAPLGKEQEKVAANRVRPLVTEAEKLLAGIKAWASTTGVEGLSKEDFDKTISTKGKAIWDEEFKKVQAKIKEVLTGFNYRGSPIEFRGSTHRTSSVGGR